MSSGLKLKGKRGFTLIELMFAMLLIATGLLATVLVSTHAGQAGERMNERMVALQDAHRVVELMRSASAAGNFPANVTGAYPNGRPVAGFNNLVNEQVTVTYADATADPLNVTITVGWRERGVRNAATQLQTLMTQRQ